MFKHILIPTDGSPLALKGVKIGVRLAKVLGAKVSGVYVSAPYVPPVLPEGAVIYVPTADPREYKKAMDALYASFADQASVRPDAFVAALRDLQRAVAR